MLRRRGFPRLPPCAWFTLTALLTHQHLAFGRGAPELPPSIPDAASATPQQNGLSILSQPATGAQTPAPGGVPIHAFARAQPPTQAADVTSTFTPEQQADYKAAIAAFNAEHYRDAETQFRALLQALPASSPGAVQVTKFASEAAIEVDDRAFALQALLPLAAADLNDWQAAALLARVYAETGDTAKRDAELAHLIELHRAGGTSPIARVQQVLLERIPESKGTIRIWYSLEPWGRYKTYLFARIYDDAGQQVERVTLESSDFDQPLFAKEHPDLAARGDRRFSLDGYGEDQHLPNGTVTQTHSTFGFFDGQPPYDTVRARIVQIAQQQAAAPISQTTHGGGSTP